MEKSNINPTSIRLRKDLFEKIKKDAEKDKRSITKQADPPYDMTHCSTIVPCHFPADNPLNTYIPLGYVLLDQAFYFLIFLDFIVFLPFFC